MFPAPTPPLASQATSGLMARPRCLPTHAQSPRLRCLAYPAHRPWRLPLSFAHSCARCVPAWIPPCVQILYRPRKGQGRLLADFGGNSLPCSFSFFVLPPVAEPVLLPPVAHGLADPIWIRGYWVARQGGGPCRRPPSE